MTGVWGKEYTGVASAPVAGTSFLQWNDAASDPIVNVEEWKEYMLGITGFIPNTLVIGYQVFRMLKQNAVIYNRIKYTNGDNITLDLLARLFEIDRMAGSRQNTQP